MGDNYSGYDDLVRSLGKGHRSDMASHRTSYKPGEESEIEVFRTSEDRVKEAKLREQEVDPRNHRQGNIKPPEESVYFRVDRSRVRKFTDEELDAFRAGCHRVVVHDYSENDFFHIPDDVRAKNDQLAKVNMKLGGLKRIYRSIDQYVNAMRIVYEAWSILADNNPIHTREEFFDYVAKGIIVSNRIIAPKMRGIDQFNQSLVMTYISNPNLDPSDLVPKPMGDPDDYLYITEDEQRFEMDCLLESYELDRIVHYDELPDEEKPSIPVKDIKRKFLKAYDEGITVRYGKHRKKRDKHKLNKSERNLQPDLSSLLKKVVRHDSGRNAYTLYSFSSLTDTYDAARKKTVWDTHRYAGSWQDDIRSSLYDLAMDEEHMNEIIPGDYSSMTYADRANSEFYKRMETAGVSTIDLRRSGLADNPDYLHDKKKAARKQNKKLENAVLTRIGRLCDSSEFKKLIKKSEQSLEKFRTERHEEFE